MVYTITHHADDDDPSAQSLDLEVCRSIVVARNPREAAEKFWAAHPDREVFRVEWVDLESGERERED